MEYDLELERVVKAINRQKARLVCVQLPDGLKPVANRIVDEIESKTKARCVIWAGSCFGACDTPLGLEKLGFDLLIQWGHKP
ncbi:MAG: diphthamide synthesis protein [Candidatus Woesearchaeota archaeon]